MMQFHDVLGKTAKVSLKRISEKYHYHGSVHT